MIKASAAEAPPQIVIVGGGFDGLSAERLAFCPSADGVDA
jgi:hypothetical protein